MSYHYDFYLPKFSSFYVFWAQLLEQLSFLILHKLYMNQFLVCRTGWYVLYLNTSLSSNKALLRNQVKLENMIRTGQ